MSDYIYFIWFILTAGAGLIVFLNKSADPLLRYFSLVGAVLFTILGIAILGVLYSCGVHYDCL